MQETTSLTIPTHVGFIVDGNRRWSREKGLPTLRGHQKGYAQLKEVGLEMLSQGVKFVSAYVFSTENWKRAEKEVSYLMKLALKMAQRDLDELIEKGVRIRFLGSKEKLSPKLVTEMNRCETKSANGQNGTLALCFNYGGHEEIANACRQLIAKGVAAEEVTPAVLRDHLYAPDIPEVDMIVRTSGEQRLSGFMLWRASYSELLFLDKKFPEMSRDDVQSILNEYRKRQRRFGGN